MSCPAGWTYSKMYRDSLQASQQQCSRVSLQPWLLESFHCQPGWFGKFSFDSDVWESSLYPSVPSAVWLGGTSQGGTPIYPFLHARTLFGCSCAVQATSDMHPRLAETRRGLLKSQKLCWFTLMGVTDGCFHPCLFSRAGPNLQTNIGPVFILFGKAAWIDHVGCWSHICQIKRAHTGASHCRRVQMQSEEWSPRAVADHNSLGTAHSRRPHIIVSICTLYYWAARLFKQRSVWEENGCEMVVPSVIPHDCWAEAISLIIRMCSFVVFCFRLQGCLTAWCLCHVLRSPHPMTTVTLFRQAGEDRDEILHYVEQYREF